jgi:hypothetical protein
MKFHNDDKLKSQLQTQITKQNMNMGMNILYTSTAIPLTVTVHNGNAPHIHQTCSSIHLAGHIHFYIL